jgi:hypothetical protein
MPKCKEQQPMSTFDKRQEGFESKFAHDEDLKFRAMAYARSVVKADFEEPGDEDVFRKVRGDFDAKGVDQSDHQLRRTMDELLQKAVDQIQSEG